MVMKLLVLKLLLELVKIMVFLELRMVLLQ